ncbi:hypothetical protein FALBO_16457 [Fusarium albosuccineum]|uniref:Uncharacterized protein n=1 Tax=Fusarium albosuccineum TaxID=1237068 RepID=A0A8H4KIY1_9HYPO|nr:hypothetical protein FALBO_16457 [Fusarium albosuccineum]
MISLIRFASRGNGAGEPLRHRKWSDFLGNKRRLLTASYSAAVQGTARGWAAICRASLHDVPRLSTMTEWPAQTPFAATGTIATRSWKGLEATQSQLSTTLPQVAQRPGIASQVAHSVSHARCRPTSAHCLTVGSLDRIPPPTIHRHPPAMQPPTWQPSRVHQPRA